MDLLFERTRELAARGISPSRADAVRLISIDDNDVLTLMDIANKVRIKFSKGPLDICALISAKSGRCREDCRFCAQSAHYDTGCEEHPLVDVGEMVARAQEAERSGAGRFCIVTSGRSVNRDEFLKIVEALALINKSTELRLDCSLGLIPVEWVDELKGAGVTRYNHNIESSREYFSSVCTTHGFEDRVETVKGIRERGMEACTGGIIGMGESREDRVDMAMDLKALGVECVPINILNPRAGTPLEGKEPLKPFDIIKTVAVFRLILPSATIKIAGGREGNLRDLQAMALMAGANGIIIGGYLTTKGRSVEDDMQMLKDLGLIK